MTEDKLNMAKKEFLDMMIESTEKDGNTSPVFALIIEDPEIDKPGIMLFPLPGEMMGNTEFKEVLVAKVLPKIAEELVADKGYTVHTTCFCFEARMWLKMKKSDGLESTMNLVEAAEEDEMTRDMMKKDPNFQDIMFVQFEDKYDREVKFYNIQKSTSVDPKGDIVSNTTLEELKELSFNTNETNVLMKGIFVDTFKIFWRQD